MIDATTVVCPVCDARPRESCINTAGRERKPHSTRVSDAQAMMPNPKRREWVKGDD